MRLNEIHFKPRQSEVEYKATLGLDPTGFTDQEWNDPTLWKPKEDQNGYPENDYMVKFFYDYNPVEKGSYERGGRQMTPDYPEQLQITHIEVLDPNTRQWVELGNYEMYLDVEHWENKILDDIRADREDYDPRAHMDDWDDDYDPRGDWD